MRNLRIPRKESQPQEEKAGQEAGETKVGDFSTCPEEPILPQALAYCSLNMPITVPTKVRLVKAMVFPVVMYGYELDYKES